MPTLKAIHICNSHQPKIAKEYDFANAKTEINKIKTAYNNVYSAQHPAGSSDTVNRRLSISKEDKNNIVKI